MIESIVLVLLYVFCFYTEYLFGPNVYACVGIAIVGYFIWKFAKAGALSKRSSLPFINVNLFRTAAIYGGVFLLMLIGSVLGPYPFDDMMLLSYLLFFFFCVLSYAIGFYKLSNLGNKQTNC